MKAVRNVKKMRAALIAGALTGAVILTGTLAWRNMTQETANEFVLEKNPGGRMHDDFNGVENKDVYAENFTDTEKGVPVFVRVKLLEYMEVGEDAGLNRTVTDPATGEEKTNPDRKATPLVAGSDINDTATWRVHKPETGGEKDPFHQYWIWDQSGNAVYMPTFNKNKDSVTVESNGTYVGSDGKFETGKPYDDYKPRKMGDSVTADAYYDADSNDVDEFDPVEDPKKDPPVPPGGGGTEKTVENPGGNYTKIEETHAANLTLNSLGVITMDEWIKAGRPVCNKWVWDSDGWFYWPEPILPQSATGLLLNKVSRSKRVTQDNYYAIHMVSQFVDADKTTWGAPASGEGDDATPATGLYEEGVTDNALALLDQATAVQVVTQADGSQKWYLSLEYNIYREILDDEGKLGSMVCAGEDEIVGTEDDRRELEYVKEGVTVNGKFYGHYLLKPTPDQPFYRAMGVDELVGTDDDDRLWLLEGWPFPSGLIDKAADAVEVTAADALTELEVGETLQFSAVVKLGDTLTNDQKIIWSVSSTSGADLKPGTAITPEGLLTVAENETETQIVVTAAAHVDDQVVKEYPVKVYGKRNVRVTTSGSATLKAGKSVTLKAWLYRGEELAAEQPGDFTWTAGLDTRSLGANVIRLEKDPRDPSTAKLTIGRGVSGKVTVTASCEGVAAEDAKPLELTIDDPEAVSVELDQPPSLNIEAGGSLTFTANVDAAHVNELETPDITWEAGTLDPDDRETIHSVTGITIPNGVLTVANDYQISRGTTIYVKATAAAPTAGGVYEMSDPITIVGPDSIEVGVKDGTAARVRVGKTLQLAATVKNGSRPYTSPLVTWHLEGNTPATTISQTGLLTVAASETLVEKTLTVTVKSVVNDVIGTLNVTVHDGSFEVGGVEFYELYRDTDNDRSLVISKYLLDTNQRFGSSNDWGTSNLRTVMTKWVTDNEVLNDAVWKDGSDNYATINIRSQWNSDWATQKPNRNVTWVATQSPAFPLSEADIRGIYFGDTAQVKDYTVVKNGKGVVLPKPPIGTWVIGKEGQAVERYWLRGPRWTTTSIAIMNANESTNAGVGNESYGNSMGVRPALWLRTSKIADQLNKTS